MRSQSKNGMMINFCRYFQENVIYLVSLFCNSAIFSQKHCVYSTVNQNGQSLQLLILQIQKLPGQRRCSETLLAIQNILNLTLAKVNKLTFSMMTGKEELEETGHEVCLGKCSIFKLSFVSYFTDLIYIAQKGCLDTGFSNRTCVLKVYTKAIQEYSIFMLIPLN